MDKSLNLLNELEISKNSPLIIGCSGGPDSMCLLHLLSKNNFNCICAHVNHNIREESQEELIFVKKYCQKNAIPFETLELSKVLNENESYYRQKRYDFYKNLAQKYKTPFILTAHHGDDLIETILMRITRGSTLKGYAGFKKSYKEDNYIFVKPLIFYTKEEILNYNTSNNIPFVLDPSNNDLIYTRNKYRHKMLPFLKSENAQVHEKYLQFSEELNEANNYFERVINNEIDKNYKNNCINLSLFLKLDKYLQKKELETILKKVYKNDVDKLQVFHIDSILSLLEKEKNFSLSLPLDYKAVREYDELKITASSNCQTYCIELKENIELPNGDKIEFLETSLDNSNNIIRLNSKSIELPLIIRTRLKEDKMEIKNMKGSKTIKSIFIDNKVPLSIRDSYPILTDSKGTILWLPGLRKSKFDSEFNQKCDIILKYTKKGDN